MLLVLYEDQRHKVSNFGLHRFVCQLVIDQCALAHPVYAVEKQLIDGWPVKGNSNLRRKCVEDLRKLSRQYRKVFAVYDEDRVHELAKVPAHYCRKLICDALLKPCEPQDSLEIVTIRFNVESLIEVIRDFQPAFIHNSELFDRALKKVLPSRDSIFNQCANQAPEVRSAVLQKMPDLARLVRKISEVLQSST